MSTLLTRAGGFNVWIASGYPNYLLVEPVKGKVSLRLCTRVFNILRSAYRAELAASKRKEKGHA